MVYNIIKEERCGAAGERFLNLWERRPIHGECTNPRGASAFLRLPGVFPGGFFMWRITRCKKYGKYRRLCRRKKAFANKTAYAGTKRGFSGRVSFLKKDFGLYI
jgi:hypothetical protein